MTKDIPADVVSEVLDRYEQVGLVDDEEFARAWIRSRASLKGVSARLLRDELERKGISRPVIDDALSASLDHDDEAAFGEDLARQKARATVRRMGPESLQSRTGREKALRRIVGAVARKGHNPSQAFAWAKSALEEELSVVRTGASGRGSASTDGLDWDGDFHDD